MRIRSRPRGLLLRQPWLDRILDGSKTWELRAHATHKRGKIFLVDVSGERWVVRGCVHIVGTARLTRKKFAQNKRLHLVDQYRVHEHRCAWVLARPTRLRTPVPVRKKRGAVIWLRLPASVVARGRCAEKHAASVVDMPTDPAGRLPRPKREHRHENRTWPPTCQGQLLSIAPPLHSPL